MNYYSLVGNGQERTGRLKSNCLDSSGRIELPDVVVIQRNE